MERKLDALKAALTHLRIAQMENCPIEQYKTLDEIMFSIQDIIEEIEGAA